MTATLMETYLGRDAAVRVVRARKLSLFPYVVGGTSFVLAGLLNPESWRLVLLSAAAASFGGASLLAWYPGTGDAEFHTSSPEVPAGLPRSIGWIVVGGIVLAVFVGIFGPGVRL